MKKKVWNIFSFDLDLNLIPDVRQFIAWGKMKKKFEALNQSCPEQDMKDRAGCEQSVRVLSIN